MKVKVRKFRISNGIRDIFDADSEEDFIVQRLTDLRPEYAGERLAVDTKLKRYEKQQKLRDEYRREYYALFPKDPPMGFHMEVDNTPAFDPFIMTNMYIWAIKNKRHWYEWPDLPKSYVPLFDLTEGENNDS